MKNFFKSIGKAICYFSVYFGWQLIVSIIGMMVLSFQLTAEMMNAGEELDTMLLAEQLTSKTMEHAMLFTVLSGVLAIATYWLIAVIRKKKLFGQVSISVMPVKGILPVAVLAACFNVITAVVMSIIPWPRAWMDSYAANASAIDNSVIAWIGAVMIAPVLEEIVFRGFIYTRLKKGMPMILAAIFTSLVFGFVHGTIIWAIYTFVFSMLLIWVFEKFKSLTACILLHMAYNLSGMAMALLPEDADVIVWVLFAVSIVLATVCAVVIHKIEVTKPVADKVVAEAEAQA